MEVITSVIGIDPGPTTGVSFIDYLDTAPQPIQIEIFQMPAAAVEHFLEAYIGWWYKGDKITAKFAQIEKFVTGQSAGTKGKAAELTRQCVMRQAEMLQLFGYAVKIRSAAEVKPWASDKRLEKLGCTASKSSLVHGRDGARHGMYTAVKDAGKADPLA
jgi:hypothetical protein